MNEVSEITGDTLKLLNSKREDIYRNVVQEYNTLKVQQESDEKELRKGIRAKNNVLNEFMLRVQQSRDIMKEQRETQLLKTKASATEYLEKLISLLKKGNFPKDKLFECLDKTLRYNQDLWDYQTNLRGNDYQFWEFCCSGNGGTLLERFDAISSQMNLIKSIQKGSEVQIRKLAYGDDNPTGVKWTRHRAKFIGAGICKFGWFELHKDRPYVHVKIKDKEEYLSLEDLFMGEEVPPRDIRKLPKDFWKSFGEGRETFWIYQDGKLIAPNKEFAENIGRITNMYQTFHEWRVSLANGRYGKISLDETPIKFPKERVVWDSSNISCGRED